MEKKLNTIVTSIGIILPHHLRSEFEIKVFKLMLLEEETRPKKTC